MNVHTDAVGWLMIRENRVDKLSSANKRWKKIQLVNHFVQLWDPKKLEEWRKQYCIYAFKDLGKVSTGLSWLH